MKNKLIVLITVSTLLFSCSGPSPRKPVVRKTSTFLDESIQRNKVLNKLEEKAFQQLIKNDSLHSYINSPHGFWYYYNTKDSLATKFPEKGDKVVYSYTIKDINGNVLYTEEELGERSYLVERQELITGLQDGIKLMKEGEIVTFLFPSYKAYGYSGYQKIQSNQPLIYTVQLKKIIKSNSLK